MHIHMRIHVCIYITALRITSALQSVLNAAAHFIVGIPKFSHISSFIGNSLHWLPIRQRIQFKICSFGRNWQTVLLALLHVDLGVDSNKSTWVDLRTSSRLGSVLPAAQSTRSRI